MSQVSSPNKSGRGSFVLQGKRSSNGNNVDKKDYYLPHYTRLKIKDIGIISYVQSSVVLNGSLLIAVDFSSISKEYSLKEQIKKNMILQINRCQQLQLKTSNQIKIQDKNHFLNITIRRDFKVSISRKYSKILFSPFEQLDIIATFSLHGIKLENAYVHFNSQSLTIPKIINVLIQNQPITDKFEITQKMQVLKVSHESLSLYCKEVRLSSQTDATYGDYQLSTKIKGIYDSKTPLHTDLQHHWCSYRTEQPILLPQTPQKNKEKSYEYTHFCFTLYRDPYASIFTIMIPIVFLGLMSLAVFFLQADLSERMGIIATLLLGFIQMVPSIRDQLIDKTKLSYIQIMTYFYTFSCFLSLLDSFSTIDLGHSLSQDPYFKICPSQTRIILTFLHLLKNNGYFKICVLINASCLIFVIVGLIYYGLYYRPVKLEQPNGYRKNSKGQEEEKIKLMKLSSVQRQLKKKQTKINIDQILNNNPSKYNQQQKELYKQMLQKSDYYKIKNYLNIPERFKEQYKDFWSEPAQIIA